MYSPVKANTELRGKTTNMGFSNDTAIYHLMNAKAPSNECEIN